MIPEEELDLFEREARELQLEIDDGDAPYVLLLSRFFDLLIEVRRLQEFRRVAALESRLEALEHQVMSLLESRGWTNKKLQEQSQSILSLVESYHLRFEEQGKQINELDSRTGGLIQFGRKAT